MKKVLIIGASVLQLPAIKKAKELGFTVGVIDYDPKAVGIPYADEYFNVSTIDIEGVAKTAKDFAPDGIMTLATDMPMRSIAEAAKVCGLPGISMDCAIKATDKAEMIRAFEAHGVAHPRYHVVSSREELEAAAQNVDFPCIMKPTDNSGSRGVVLVHDREELLSSYEYARSSSRGGSVIVEEYLQGSEVSVELLVLDGEPHVLQVTDKLTTGAPHFVEMGHSQPSRLNERALLSIRALAAAAAKAVGIHCGAAHAEIILTENGPKMVEIGARMGGDCITTHLVPLSTGVDMVRAVLEIACGETPDISARLEKGSAIRYFYAPCGTIQEISGVEEAKALPGVQEIVFTKGVGDAVGEIGSSSDRIGFVIVQADTAEEAVAVCERAVELIMITVE